MGGNGLHNTEIVTVIHTNDLHSHFEAMPRIAEAIRRIKDRQAGKPCIVADIGDHMDRMFAETEGTLGRANSAVLNQSGYDIVVPGNNEGLTLSKLDLEQLYDGNNTYQAICSNMIDKKTQQHQTWMPPYTILEKNGIRIGFIGVTADFNDFYQHLGWYLSPPIETVERYVHLIRNEVDVVIVCSHLGLSRDKELAERISGIDVILGGHTHHLLLEPLKIGKTLICATGKFGAYVGEVRLEIDTQTREIIQREACCHEINEFPPLASTQELIQSYREKSQQALSEHVAELSRPLSNAWESESPLGNLLARSIKDWVGTDAAIVNAGQLLSSLEAGGVTRAHMLQICPSPINACKMKILGSSLRKALEEALLPSFIHMPIKGFGFRGKVLGTLCLDGIQVYYQPSKPNYNKIDEVYIQGKPLIDDCYYTIATIDMFTFGVGYLSLQDGIEIDYFLPDFLRDLLSVKLHDVPSIEASFVPRWINTQS